MHSILSARILLHLRGAKRKGNTEIAMMKPADLFPTVHRPYGDDLAPRRESATGINFDFTMPSQAGVATTTSGTAMYSEESETVLEQWFGDDRRRAREVGAGQVELEVIDAPRSLE